jgi:heat shock protein HslJ
MSKWYIWMMIAVLAGMLSACVGSTPSIEPDLEGGTWVLTDLNGVDPLETRRPTLEFEAGQVSGNTGCNHYGGSFTLQGNAIQFEGLFSTEMACLDPAGMMEQERVYLDLLKSADRLVLTDGVLTLYAGSNQILTFEMQVDAPAVPAPTVGEPTPVPPTPTDEIPEPTATAAAFVPPEGFKEYRDAAAGISVYIPESWTVTSVIEGEFAILQSYPEDKYIGGEMFEPGDAKCDFSIRPPGTRAADLLDGWRSDPATTILSEEQITLETGQPAYRVELESMGPSLSVLTEVNQRTVRLSCFGDFSQIDEIARTIQASE